MPIALFRIDTESSADIRSELMALPAELREDFLLARPELLADMARRATIAEANDRAAVLLRAPTAKSLIGTSLTHYWSRRMDSYRRSVTARSSGQYLEEETQVVALDGTIIDVIFAMAWSVFVLTAGGSAIALVMISTVGVTSFGNACARLATPLVTCI